VGAEEAEGVALLDLSCLRVHAARASGQRLGRGETTDRRDRRAPRSMLMMGESVGERERREVAGPLGGRTSSERTPGVR
jgi:hypothetical protein